MPPPPASAPNSPTLEREPGRRISLPRRGFGETSRKDLWWVTPLAVFLGLSTFVVYSTWAAFQGKYYYYSGQGANYLSPFYSPLIFGPEHHAVLGERPGWIPAWVSPALLILWIPAG